VPAGQSFAADDAFLSPDSLSLVANDETDEMIDQIDIATGRITWPYGHYNRAGSRWADGFLMTPLGQVWNSRRSSGRAGLVSDPR
jgi:hypothetical protein